MAPLDRTSGGSLDWHLDEPIQASGQPGRLVVLALVPVRHAIVALAHQWNAKVIYSLDQQEQQSRQLHVLCFTWHVRVGPKGAKDTL